jgi:hypothetical protein
VKKLVVLTASAALISAGLLAGPPAQATAPAYNISTLAGKVASLNGTAGLQIRFSAYVEEEANTEVSAPSSPAITPTNVLSSPLDGTSVAAPAVTVNQDTAAAPQNETAIAVDPKTTPTGCWGAPTTTWHAHGPELSQAPPAAPLATGTQAPTSPTTVVPRGAAALPAGPAWAHSSPVSPI